jgi:hypothetical protein
MAKAPKVRLYIRIRRSDGTDAFVDPAWNRNRTLREGYARIERQPEHHPEGVYYLRFLRDGKRVWEAVGSDANAAIVALRNTEHDLRSIALGRAHQTRQSSLLQLNSLRRRSHWIVRSRNIWMRSVGSVHQRRSPSVRTC